MTIYLMDIIVTGTLGYDYIMDFPGLFADRIMPDKIHTLSLSFLVNTLTKQYGGTAGNIAHNLKLMGLNPLICASLGRDGDEYLKFLKRKKIQTKFIKLYKTVNTSAYFVITDKNDNQIGSFFTGPIRYEKSYSVCSVSDAPSLVILAPTDPQAMIAYVKECRMRDLPYMYDPAFQISVFSSEELKLGIEGCKILIGNDYEIALIEDKLDISHEELRTMVPVVVTTLGPKGSIVETRYESIHCKPAKALKVVDPTGAGDAYRAGFIYGYLQHFDLQVCGQLGSTSAVYAIEKYGTQKHTYSFNEFKTRYTENFGQDIPL